MKAKRGRDGMRGDLHIQVQRLVFACPSRRVEMCLVDGGLADGR